MTLFYWARCPGGRLPSQCMYWSSNFRAELVWGNLRNTLLILEAKRSNQSILKEINSEYSLEGLMLKLKLWYFWPLDARSWLIGKDLDSGKDWRQEEKGMTEVEMIGWHHQLNGHEFEQALGVADGQRSLAWCSPWGCKELNMTEWLNGTELIHKKLNFSFLFPLDTAEVTWVHLYSFLFRKTFIQMYTSSFFLWFAF